MRDHVRALFLLAVIGILSACGDQAQWTSEPIATAADPQATIHRNDWPVKIRYKVQRRHPETGVAAVLIEEFTGSSWREWTNVAVDGPPSEVGKASTFSENRFRAGIVREPQPPRQPLEHVRAINRDFTGHVDVQIDDRPSRPSEDVGDVGLDDPGLPVTDTIVPPGEINDEGEMAPSDVLNTWFGKPWDHDDSPYRPLTQDELESPALFSSAIGMRPEETAQRLGLPSDEAAAFAYLAPEACAEPGDLATCERFVSVAHARTGIPLEVQFIDIDGGMTLLHVEVAEFGAG